MANKFTSLHIGPAIIAVIVFGGIAISGVILYKSMLNDEEYEARFNVSLPEGYFSSLSGKSSTSELYELSTSTEIRALEQDLATPTDSYIDTSLLDDIDEALIDYQELEELNQEF